MARATLWLRDKASASTIPTGYILLEIEDVNSKHWWNPRPCRRCDQPRGEHDWVLSIGFERVLDCSDDRRDGIADF